jgi:hypothetical protein
MTFMSWTRSSAVIFLGTLVVLALYFLSQTPVVMK